MGLPVFDTNSVATNDAEDDTMPIDLLINKYGRDGSYLYYVEQYLVEFVSSESGVVFVDSFKAAADLAAASNIFPECSISTWFLHAPDSIRSRRYFERDVATGRRSENLSDHDSVLEQAGIFRLIRHASEVFDMTDPLEHIAVSVGQALSRIGTEPN
jgi:hypothetical protein